MKEQSSEELLVVCFFYFNPEILVSVGIVYGARRIVGTAVKKKKDFFS